ncbi:MAG: GAF domain-containing protein, partial [Bdellovibrionales bacterium]|nr:GAF domain-containing protein [Bdellovibrionales bacterium]
MDEYKKSRIKIYASQELAKSLGFLDTLLENLPLMVLNDYDLFPKDQADHFVKYDREVLKGGGIVDIPFEVVNTKYQEQRILHTKKIPIYDANGKTIYLLGVSEDITEKVESERLKREAQEIDAARIERLRMNERETFVSNAISSLSTTLDYQETLNRLVAAVVPTICDWSTVLVKNENGCFLRVAGIHRQSPLIPLLDELNESFPPNSNDIELSLAFERGDSSLIKNLDDVLLRTRAHSPRRFEIFSQLGTHSSVIVPIIFRGKIMGALSVVRGPDWAPFNELDLILVEEIGRRAGAVLENSLLFKSTQKAVKARDEFLSIASHELKTPITSLKMQLQMLARVLQDETILKPINNSIKQVDRLTLLVNDLLDVSKFESGRMSYNFQTFSLSQLLRDAAGNMNSAIVVEVNDEVDIEG